MREPKVPVVYECAIVPFDSDPIECVSRFKLGSRRWMWHNGVLYLVPHKWPPIAVTHVFSVQGSIMFASGIDAADIVRYNEVRRLG